MKKSVLAVIGSIMMSGQVAAADELSETYAKGLEFFRAENYEAALPHFRRTLQLAEEQFGPNDPKVAVELNNLAEVYRLMGNYEAAEPLYERALELDENNLDPGSPDLATSLNNLALLYRAQDRLSEAEALYERSLDILQSALGPRHPNVAKSLNNLAVLYDAQGRTAEAAALIERAVSISRETLGAEHPTTVTLSENLDTMSEEKQQDTVIAAAPADETAATDEPAQEDIQTATSEEPVASETENQLAVADQTPANAQTAETLIEQAAIIEPAAGGGDFVIHLASVRTTEDAASEWRRLTGIHELPETVSQIEPAKVTTANGDFYRVWGGSFPDEAAAAKACEPITAKGDYCRVMKVN